MKVLFRETKRYNEYLFVEGKVYDFKEEPEGFIERWIKRGCEVVEDAKEFLPDPRFPVEVVEEKVEIKVEEPVVEEEVVVEEVIEEVKDEEPVIDEEVKVEKKKKRNKKTGK